jgi:hypothetical protein
MKQTLFEIVDDILNDLDADKVNSITDTVESEQVAQIVKSCYYEMLSNRNWPHTRKLVQFEALGDVTKPNYLLSPDNMKELVFFKYEMQKAGDPVPLLVEVKYKHPDDFLRLTARRTGPDIQQVVDFSGSTLLIYNNAAPQYWTSFDDVHVVTDSFDSAVESSHQKSKTQALAFMYPSWTMEDTFVPDLPSDAFSALIEEAKSTAFLALKQMPNQKAEQKAGRQQRWLSRKAWNLHGGVRYPDYGRKRSK